MVWWKKIRLLENELACVRKELFDIKWESKNRDYGLETKLNRLTDYLGVVERITHKTEFVKKGGPEQP